MGALVVLGLLLGIYFTPAIVAAARSHRQAVAIAMLNLFLGWTVLGWVVSLVWACMNPSPPPTVIHQVIQSPGPVPPPTPRA